MPGRIIDISSPLRADIASDPAGMEPHIEYLNHRQTAESVCAFFPGLVPSDLPNGEGWAIERVEITTHNGTHLDAPFQPGVKLDFRHFADGYVVTPRDVEAELQRIGHALRPLDIVVVNTRAGSRYGKADYVAAGCGMGREATLYLTSRGVRVTGTDAWSRAAKLVIATWRS